jgi:serine/threonine-protein kinase
VTTSPQPDLAASLTGRYTIEREVGHGGMATVYLARDLRHERLVALKVLRPDLGAAVGAERFAREIKLAARLQHPHILSVFDSGETATGQLWFTMPYVEGESLRDRIRREHQLSLEETVRITREAALALQYAHEHGIVHRDIKPENVLLTKDGSTLVADFGIARALDTAPSATGESLTATGMVVGTPQYMSPEQAAGDRDVGPRSDVYSLGAVAYEMLTGEPPFTGATAQAVVAKMMSGEAPSVRRARPSVPEAVDVAIRRALAPVPADRYATAAEFAKAMDAAERTTAAPAAVITSARGRRRVPVGAALLGLGICIGAGFLFAWRSREGSMAAPGGAIRLAVLPFENLGDSADAYFADGMTDALRGKLAALPGVEIIGATSSGQYRHSTETAQQIGNELGARYLLVGKIRWAKGAGGQSRVQVSPELLDARTAATRWGAPFDAAMTDVFQVQADVAGKVAQALGVALSTGERDSLAARPTHNLAAYNAYLQGTEFLHNSVGEADAHRRAVLALRQATTLDSGFAEAWAALAVGESRQYQDGTNSSLPDSAIAAAAKMHAERAINIGPRLALAHWALASYYSNVLGDYRRAVAEDSAALQLTPNDVDVLSAMASSELALDHRDAAVALYQRAQTLDPRSLSAALGLSEALGDAGRYADATAAVERGLQLDPTRVGLLMQLSDVRLMVGDSIGARAALDRALAVEPTSLVLVQTKVRSHLFFGDLAGARSVVAVPPPGVDPDALLAWIAVSWDLYWILDDAQQQRLFTMPPSTFNAAVGGNPRDRALALAHTAWLRGDTLRARSYADSAFPFAVATVRGNPTNADAHGLLADVEVYMGQRAAALRDAHEAVRMAELHSQPFDRGYLRVQLARVFTVLREPDSAVTALEPVPSLAPLSYPRAFFRVDPTWTPLRGNLRFQRLVAQPAAAPPPAG